MAREPHPHRVLEVTLDGCEPLRIGLTEPGDASVAVTAAWPGEAGSNPSPFARCMAHGFSRTAMQHWTGDLRLSLRDKVVVRVGSGGALTPPAHESRRAPPSVDDGDPKVQLPQARRSLRKAIETLQDFRKNPAQYDMPEPDPKSKTVPFALRLVVNDEKAVLVGHRGFGGTTVSLTLDRRTARGARDTVKLDALGQRGMTHLFWIEERPLRVGDVVRVEVVKATRLTKPVKEHAQTAEQVLEQVVGAARKRVEKLAAKSK